MIHAWPETRGCPLQLAIHANVRSRHPCHSLLVHRSVPHGLSKRSLALESFELAAHARRHRLQIDGQFFELSSELERHPVDIVLDDRCTGVGAYVKRLVERKSGTNRLLDSTLCDALAVDQ